VAVTLVHRLAGVDPITFLVIVPLLLGNLLPYVLPIAYLLAVVFTYGRIAMDNEWTAIRMAGFHPLRSLLPALPLAVLLGAGSLWFTSEALPAMRRTQEQTAFAALRETIVHLSPGRTELHFGKFSLIARARQGDEFLDAVIHVPAVRGGEARTLAARGARIRFEEDVMLVQLIGARSVQGERDFASESVTVRLDLDELQHRNESRYQSLRYRTSAEILEALRDPALDAKRAEQMRFEIHQRAAIAAIYLMFLLLGMPVGLLVRSSTQLRPLAIAMGIALVYYLLALRLGQQLAKNHIAPPLLCAWAVNVLGMGVGAILLGKAIRQ
jgi:lipopolysaccharide export LptBFGC system permease protein LptF